ncbi:helix-turn-helix domain-containing protein [Catenuloplanes atrovinosus]|uniref:Transcriptional regulator with XRE-family HTH domain n=1 Tax=Catenuloplanes atrovinosus TaxID=137266 RepID=A0AAE3YTV2_9ACTN|nr:helix-turn-helix transcriptional regulator [Catenuloplanes atrovinosus]MDR7279833.1 transcriptional regulator with XRE-family HTH domain [Catenuloplanes atrovinosus]
MQRQRLRVTLRDLREERGLSEREVAAALGWQPLSKLLRIERGAVDISIMDLCVLLHHYGIEDDAQVQELIRVASQAHRRQQFERFHDILPSEYSYFLQYESAASILRSFEPSLVPGLLQTEEYARALYESRTLTSDSEETKERRVQLRMQRQEILTRTEDFQAFFIMDEAVLHHEVGGPVIMLRQLRHIRTMIEKPNVDVRIVPFHRGAYTGLWGAFVVLEFPSPDTNELVFIEHRGGGLTIDAKSSAPGSYVELFWVLEDCSASAPETGDLIDRAINRLAGAQQMSGSP